jgi:hypothetical protein
MGAPADLKAKWEAGRDQRLAKTAAQTKRFRRHWPTYNPESLPPIFKSSPKPIAGPIFAGLLNGLYIHSGDLRFKIAYEALHELGMIDQHLNWRKEYRYPGDIDGEKKLFQLINMRVRFLKESETEARAWVAAELGIDGPSWEAVMKRLQRICKRERAAGTPPFADWTAARGAFVQRRKQTA